MRHSPFFEFYFQIIALMLSIIVVHTAYITVVRPQAQAELSEQIALQAAGGIAEISRSGYVVIKDYEQEACFIL
ncbi:MAG: MotA/TolQ/ExbB proton channel family protein, partial [Gammaproteobacteria bacterium]